MLSNLASFVYMFANDITIYCIGKSVDNAVYATLTKITFAFHVKQSNSLNVPCSVYLCAICNE